MQCTNLSHAQTFPTPHNDVYALGIERPIDKNSSVWYYRNATLLSVDNSSPHDSPHIFLLGILKEKDFSIKKAHVYKEGLLGADGQTISVVEILNRKTGLTLFSAIVKYAPQSPVLLGTLPEEGSVLEVAWRAVWSFEVGRDGLHRTYAVVSSLNRMNQRFILAIEGLDLWGFPGCAVYREGRLVGIIVGKNPSGAGYEVQVITRNLLEVRE